METIELLKEKIESGIKSNLEHPDADYRFMLDQLWIVAFETTQALKRYVDGLDVNKLSDKEMTCMFILSNCLTDFFGAFHALRGGFHRVAAIAGRGLLENLALVVTIKNDETDQVFNEYKTNNYDIPKAITPAKAVFPHIGKVYGILSNTFVHEPHAATGRAFVTIDAKQTLLLLPSVSRDEFLIQFLLIANMGILAQTLGEAVEWTFANWIEPTVYWKMHSDNSIKTTNNNASSANLKIAYKFEEILKKRPT